MELILGAHSYAGYLLANFAFSVTLNNSWENLEISGVLGGLCFRSLRGYY